MSCAKAFFRDIDLQGHTIIVRNFSKYLHIYSKRVLEKTNCVDSTVLANTQNSFPLQGAVHVKNRQTASFGKWPTFRGRWK